LAFPQTTFEACADSPQQRMITGRDIIILSSIEWEFLWQGPQEIASRLARAGNRVLYIENTGVRSPTLRDARRVVSRLISWAATFASKGLRTVESNLYVSSPVVLPPLGGRSQRELNRRIFLPLVCRAATQLGLRNPIIVSFLPTDTAVDLIERLRCDRSVVVYYCVADFVELSTRPSRMVETERELLNSSDVVLAQCVPLAVHCSQWTKDIQVIPYGVNLDHFSSNGLGIKKEVDAAVAKNTPVIGYLGGLHRHVDLNLLVAMAQARPDWKWVCLGPAQVSVRKLAALQNVKLLGELPHHKLAEHIETFDVGIVPYVRSSYTDTVVPTKISEYLAMGKAVVSTNLPSVCNSYSWDGAVITVEPTLEKFIAAVGRALALPRDAATKARRRAIAALGDWEARLEQICAVVDAAIEAKSKSIY